MLCPKKCPKYVCIWCHHRHDFITTPGILLDLFEQQDHLFLLLPGGKVFRKQDYENCTKFSTDFKILTFLYFI